MYICLINKGEIVEPEKNQPVTLAWFSRGVPTDESKVDWELVMQTAGFIMETFVPTQGVVDSASDR